MPGGPAFVEADAEEVVDDGKETGGIANSFGIADD